MKIEAVAIEVFHCELTQTPGPLFERLNDSRAQRAQFVVCGIDVCRKYPVNRRPEGPAFAAEEDRDVISRHGADLLSGMQPTNLETKVVTVMLLSSFDVRYRQLWCRMAEGRSQFLLVHNVLVPAARVLRCLTLEMRQRESNHSSRAIQVGERHRRRWKSQKTSYRGSPATICSPAHLNQLVVIGFDPTTIP